MSRSNVKRGWYNHSTEHGLASRGIRTAVKDSPEARVKIMKAKPFVSETTELKSMYSSQASFYGKAEVESTRDGSELMSYGTKVAEIKNGVPIVHGTYSQTTTRHIKEYLKQNGFKVESTKQIMDDYGGE